ncbi:MAG TPA: FAD-dependent oxidoreductase, partial [Steroidobacteraceae bacterium]|nr:FAD-dependent oxidoreductase [Steroidobacteraceae bacterium]
LLGATDEARAALRPESFYADKRIELLTGRRVIALDRAHHHAALDDDRVIEYGHFVFAVGARNRPLPVRGTELRGVHCLRTLDEARALKAALETAKHAVVIGAGFIGLEVAATAMKLGVEVTVIEVADRPMARALSPQIAAIFTREHQKHGMRFMFNSQVLHILGEAGRAVAVATVEHERVPADVIVIGIGVQPNVEVAAAAGLDVRNGIVVDEMLLTSDPNVSAVGDCAAHPNPFADASLVRLESVQNATDQGRCVAARLVGKPARYANVPWFWSDQAELKLQIAGLTQGYDQLVIRGDASGIACSAFCFKAGRLIGVESVNRPGDHMLARRLVGQHVALTPAQAADPTFDLKAHLAQAAAAPATVAPP